MDATANFSLRFARASDSKAETTDWMLSRQTPQRISTGISLISLALGFWVFAMMVEWLKSSPGTVPRVKQEVMVETVGSAVSARREDSTIKHEHAQVCVKAAPAPGGTLLNRY